MAEGAKQTLLRIVEELITDVSNSAHSIPTSEVEPQAMEVDETPTVPATTEPGYEIPSAKLHEILSLLGTCGIPSEVVEDTPFRNIFNFDTVISNIFIAFREDFGFEVRGLTPTDYADFVPTFTKKLGDKLAVLKGLSHEHLVRLIYSGQMKRKQEKRKYTEQGEQPQEEATQAAWKAPFKGDTHNRLWAHIVKTCKLIQTELFYAKYFAVVQSSGMGKSRTIDKLSETKFTIPINLRAPKETGYPPSDRDVHSYFTSSLIYTKQASFRRAEVFLEALFILTSDILQNKHTERIGKLVGSTDIGFNSPMKFSDLAARFRSFMAFGIDRRRHGPFRTWFYKETVAMATKLFDEPQDANGQVDRRRRAATSAASRQDDSEVSALVSAACKLQKSVVDLCGDDLTTDESERWQTGFNAPGSPLILLVFDEARTISAICTDNQLGPWSHFSELGRALRYLKLNPIFALFLSTTGKLDQFGGGQTGETSLRVEKEILRVVNPFYDFSYNLFASPISANSSHILVDLTKNEHIVKYGRPLWFTRWSRGDKSVQEDIICFARTKLLNSTGWADAKTNPKLLRDQLLATLFVRVPFDINTATIRGYACALSQVEGNLRVVDRIDYKEDVVFSHYPMESVVAEASCLAMSNHRFSMLSAFQHALDGSFALDDGEVGECIGVALLLMARDAAVGVPAPRLCSIPTFLTKLLKNLPVINASKVNKNHTGSSRQVKKRPRPDSSSGRVSTSDPEEYPVNTLLAESAMFLTQFVKLQGPTRWNSDKCLAFLSQGAGILCPRGTPGIDAITPFVVHHDKPLAADNLGLILWQYKNDYAYQEDVKSTLFDRMDTFLNDFEGDLQVVIRVVVCLPSTSPVVKCVRPEKCVKGPLWVVDLWIAGLDSFEVLEEATLPNWKELLTKESKWKCRYELDDLNTLGDLKARRQANPGLVDEAIHFQQWWTLAKEVGDSEHNSKGEKKA